MSPSDPITPEDMLNHASVAIVWALEEAHRRAELAQWGKRCGCQIVTPPAR